HGVCYGGGLQIAAGADLRIATPDTRLSVMELKWGIVPDMGHFTLWRGLVRGDVLRELTYTTREFSGTEAQAMGFVTHTDTDPLARAMAIAHDIAGKNPDAIRAAKRLFALCADASEEAILTAESEEQSALLGSANQTEAVQSAMAGREARFEAG
ncbi:MAG: enoyl-CoA hydratase/isomerase family protein, partial [Betaproteobacteria bacterium]|nr:enoyl-CoA hydratase/isomerase family protein [Betaproteobacteria bacterium]